MELSSLISKWREHLSQFKVKDLIPSNFELIKVNQNQTILEGLQLLTKKKISCAPIWDDEKKEFSGQVSVFDLLTAVVCLSDFKPIVDVLSKNKNVDWQEYIKRENETISDQPIAAVSNLSQREPFSPVWEGFPLLSLMDMFSKDVNLHHVPVNNGDGTIIAFISQSRVIEFLQSQLGKFPELAKLKLSALTFSTDKKKIVSVNINDVALDAFRKMMDEGVSGVVVVDEKGKLVGVISANDLKGSLPQNLFSDLYLPVGEYLEKCTVDYQRENSRRPIASTEEDTVETLLEKLTTKHVHRVIVVNGENDPMYVLSLCDVITILDYIK